MTRSCCSLLTLTKKSQVNGPARRMRRWHSYHTVEDDLRVRIAWMRGVKRWKKGRDNKKSEGQTERRASAGLIKQASHCAARWKLIKLWLMWYSCCYLFNEACFLLPQPPWCTGTHAHTGRQRKDKHISNRHTNDAHMPVRAGKNHANIGATRIYTHAGAAQISR